MSGSSSPVSRAPRIGLTSPRPRGKHGDDQRRAYITKDIPTPPSPNDPGLQRVRGVSPSNPLNGFDLNDGNIPRRRSRHPRFKANPECG